MTDFVLIAEKGIESLRVAITSRSPLAQGLIHLMPEDRLIDFLMAVGGKPEYSENIMAKIGDSSSPCAMRRALVSLGYDVTVESPSDYDELERQALEAKSKIVYPEYEHHGLIVY